MEVAQVIEEIPNWNIAAREIIDDLRREIAKLCDQLEACREEDETLRRENLSIDVPQWVKDKDTIRRTKEECKKRLNCYTPLAGPNAGFIEAMDAIRAIDEAEVE